MTYARAPPDKRWGKDSTVARHNCAALTSTEFLKVNYGDETYSRSHAA